MYNPNSKEVVTLCKTLIQQNVMIQLLTLVSTACQQPSFDDVLLLFEYFYFLYVQVVVKFISKVRIVNDCWVDDPMLGRVSQEIAILTRVQHHNIVKVTGLNKNLLFIVLNYFAHHICVSATRCWRCLRMGVTSRW